jgi:putative membrane protein
MERRLLRAIINPAMVVTWILGLWLAWQGPDSHYGWFSEPWLQLKLARVRARAGVHGLFVRWVADFAADRTTPSQKLYRIINEVPTLIMIAVVVLAVVKPF